MNMNNIMKSGKKVEMMIKICQMKVFKIVIIFSNMIPLLYNVLANIVNYSVMCIWTSQCSDMCIIDIERSMTNSVCILLTWYEEKYWLLLDY